MLKLTIVSWALVGKDDATVYIRPEYIAAVEAFPSNKPATKITMFGGTFYTVAESPEEIVKMIEEAF